MGETLTMADRPDWEKANRNERAQKQGTVRADADMPPPQSLARPPEKTKEGRELLQRLRPLYQPKLDEFERFASDVQLSYLARYETAIKEITSKAREKAAPAERGQLWRVFSVAEDEAKARLRKALKSPPGASPTIDRLKSRSKRSV